MNYAIGIMIPFICTSIGAAFVFFFEEKMNEKWICGFLAFSSGIMVSASFFSLLLPAMDSAKESPLPWISICLSFFMGALFLIFADKIAPQRKTRKTTSMMILAVTLHNIPEGMAVGLMFGLAIESNDVVMFSNAMAFSIGIAIQNIPEGAAVALPLKKDGYTNKKAFTYGMLSGIVEPIFALIAVFSIHYIDGLMPWFLSFAAGAMIYVVVKELIPESQMGYHPHLASFIFTIGFVLMMLLDLAL